ncbi:alpha-2-macroglobulin family protein [Gymnodinialimonas ceratoperidinii]|uniref:Alpha-2-macroglobulin family protein n=1 Tax=Gymnodinialimonas ceratoperidinii TaxID=2856823 RepID=A0A8F6TW68_9RHOB|nr:alpha-2-macroglobulin family protein [Gymnodinialimonas ceratoperidinii]QXT40061.1 alpha-2-macroglobulin family protein [Gymnodinialimonas ceratoperidinii]
MSRIIAAAVGILLALSGPISAQDSLPDRTTRIIRDTDLPGNDLRPIFDTTLTDCTAACRADPDCAAFTFNATNNTCFPKTVAGEAVAHAGAMSGILQTTPEPAHALADQRRGELGFLRDTDFDGARAQAEGLGLVHYAGQFPADDWRRSARNAFDEGNQTGAMRRIGAAITVEDHAEDWVTYATYLLALEPDDYATRQRYEARALDAAVNAALRSEDGTAFAQSLDVLAGALERRGRGQDAIPALRLALSQADAPQRAEALDRVLGLYGFRVTDTRVDVEADFPRVCAIFSEPLAPGGVTYQDFVQTTASDVAVEAEGRQLCLSGLRHGERIAFTLRAGLPAASGETLHAPITLRQYVRDREPSVRFAGRAYILPAAGNGSIPLVGVNTDVVDLRLFHVSDRNILRTMQQDYFGRPLAEWQVDQFADEIGEPVWQGEAEVAEEPNRSVTTRVPIGEVLQGRAPGLYALEARVGGAGTSEGGATQWFLVSDLGISAMSGADGVHVLVRSLATTAPHAGATVDLISESNRVLAQLETDSDGYVHFPASISAGLQGAAPALLTVRNGDDDLAFLSLRDAEFDLSDRGVEGRAPAGPIDVFLATDRGIYRAGDTIHLTALARDPQAQALTGLPLTAILTRPDGVEYTRHLLEEAGAGGFVADLALGPDVPRGTWRLAIHADPDAPALRETRLLVEDFLPERLDLRVDLDIEIETARFQADYLFGAPAGNLPISGRLALRPRDTLPDYPGFRFGRHDAPPEAAFNSLAPLQTDADGAATAPLILPSFDGINQPGDLTLTAQIIEGSGRPVERAVTAIIVPDAPLIGIRPLFDGTLPEGVEAPFHLITTGAAPLPVRWTLNRVERRYQWYRQNGNWTWEPITTRQQVATGEATLTDAPFALDLSVDWGSYELRVESDTGGFAVTSVGFSAGWYGARHGTDTPDALEVSLDAEAYLPGDTATLRIVPRTGGLALVQVVTDRLIDQRIVQLGDEPEDVTLPVTDDWGSGAYVAATLIRPLETVSGPTPTRAIGLAHAAVDPGDRALSVSLELPDSMRPNRSLNVAMQVEGARPGDIVHATMAAVDVGILNLTGFEAPDPQGHYFGQRRLGMAYRDIYGRLIDNRDGAEGRIRQGGDASSGLRMQADPASEEALALFSGPLEFGQDGIARASFDVPAFNGTLRVMAVAWSETGVGQAEADIVVRDPVVITASAPRFLAPNDRAQLLLEFSHTDGPSGEMPLTVSTSSNLQLTDEIPAELSLAEGGATRVVVPFTAADQVGRSEITVALTTPDGTEITQTIAIPVQANDPEIAETTRVTLAPGESFTIDAAALTGFHPDSARVVLSAGPLARYDVAGLLQRLDRYPYGCTEQTASRAMPLLYLSSVAQALDLGTADDLDARIEEAIASVLTNQSASGSFGLWRASSGDLWLDAYVSDFLSRAREEGHAVPDIPFQSALDNLANAVASYPDFEDGGEGLAYALMVLAREGQASMGDLRYYADVKAPDFSTALALGQLGAALAMYGDQPRADAMFAAGLARLSTPLEPDGGPSWRVDYGSQHRDAAGLVALATAAGSRAVSLPASGFELLPDAGDASTQEAVWTLLAAHALIDNPAVVGLQLDGAPMAGPMTLVVDNPSLTRRLENVGTRDETITLSRFGRPIGATEAFGNGYRIDREYLTLEGEVVDPSQVAQGTRLVTILTITNTGAPEGRLMVNDPLPAGFEIDNPNLLQSGDVRALDNVDIRHAPAMSEFRAERFLSAIDMRGTHERMRIAYIVRAVSPGEFHHPAASVEDMYRPTYRAQTASGQVRVTGP